VHPKENWKKHLRHRKEMLPGDLGKSTQVISPNTQNGCPIFKFQWIGLRENLQESPIFNGNLWFPVDFPLNQSIESWAL
jgi:hypothetical protein